MTFEEPVWLALTPFLVLISAALIRFGWRKRSKLLSRFAASRLLDQLTERASVKRKLLKSLLVVGSFGALGLALARPQYGIEWSERKARGLDIVFVLDSSKSMLATDLRPSRLERAKFAILDLVERLEGDRIGLVAFAGQAFLQTPPTLDYNAFRESLSATDPSILSRGGSDLGRAIDEAAKAFPSENNVKVVVLLTDGEDLGGQAITSARTAAENGIQIFTVGIGTPEGEYLRVRNEIGIEEFLRDNNGQPVRSQLDESTLQQVARLTDGSYTRLDGGSLEVLYDSVLATLPREERESELQEVRIERFQWLLALVLLFLILEMLIRNRQARGAELPVVLFSLLLFTPTGTEAHPAFNEAHASILDGEFERANELYTETMQETTDRTLQRDALYNMGHATHQIARMAYQSGDLQTALEKMKTAEGFFESALELDASDTTIADDSKAARKVREAIEALLDRKPEEQQENPASQNEEASEDSPQEEGSSSRDEERSNQKNDPEPSSEDSGGQNENEPDQTQTDASESGQQSGEPEDRDSQDEATGQSPESETDETTSPGDPSGQSQTDGEATEDQRRERSSDDEPAESGGDNSQSMPIPEIGEPDQTGEEATRGRTQNGGTAAIEGMTIQEAQDLLDSLRGKEEILPFAKPSTGRGGSLQDW